MNIKRIVRHLLMPPWWPRRLFTRAALQRIEAAIGEAERRAHGQIRFAVEGALHLVPLWHGLTARERALEVFSRLRVWDTEHNNGVLIYLLLADRDVEIVADRGIHAKTGSAQWERVCRRMETHFRAGRFEEGVIEGIRDVGAHLARHYPGERSPDNGASSNELPDAPIIL